MPSRICARCGQQKSIRGVWYLTPQRAGPATFVCESCYGLAGREMVAVPG